ncbi:MAG: hypothetical protein GY711_20740 [bacterium]|nr:hypothetical protein [bacterium]
MSTGGDDPARAAVSQAASGYTADRPVAPLRASLRGWPVALLVGLLLLVFAPQLLRGRVLYPHDNAAEAGVRPEGFADANAFWLIDQTNLYAPELHAHIASERSGWLATWNPHNELGRPLFQSGLGSSFLIGHVVAAATRDAFYGYTWMAVLAVLGTALFTFLFLRELGLQSLACVVGALGLSVGPLYPGWQVLPLIQWGFCWAFAVLFAVQRWLRVPSVWTWLLCVFAVHAILLSGFQQHVILLGWMVVGWIVLAVMRSRATPRARLRAFLAIAGAGALAVLTVLPVYLDLYLDWRRSLRSVVGSDTPTVVERLWPTLYGVFWRRDQGGLSYSLSPVYAGFVALAFTRLRQRDGLYWAACFGGVLLASASTQANHALRYFGLALSDWQPIYGVHLPAAVLAALGVDHVLRVRRRAQVVAAAAVLVAGLGALPLMVDRLPGELLASELWLGSVLGLGVCAFAASARGWLLVPLLAVGVFHHGDAFVVWRPRKEIRTDSALARELRERTADGSRFAWVGARPRGGRFVPPNQEIVLDLASVHTYDHFVSRAFDAWVRPLRAPAKRKAYDRRFLRIATEQSLDDEFFAKSGVSTLLSLAPLSPRIAREHARFGEVIVSVVERPGPLVAHLAPGMFQAAEGEFEVESERLYAAQRVVPREWRSDHMRIDVEPSTAETLLFVSQQFHPQWKARADGLTLVTAPIDAVYQGVLLPPGTASIELSFEPWSRWALAPQVAFALAAAAFVAMRLRRPKRTHGRPR